MKSFATEDLMDQLMEQLRPLVSDARVFFIADLDLTMPRRLEGDSAAILEAILCGARELLSDCKSREFAARLTYLRKAGGGDLLVILRTDHVRSFAFPLQGIEAAPVVKQKISYRIVAYYEKAAQASDAVQNAYYVAMQHLTSQLGMEHVFCTSIPQLQMELDRVEPAILLMTDRQFRTHRDYFLHIALQHRMILAYTAGEKPSEASRAASIEMPYSTLDLARLLGRIDTITTADVPAEEISREVDNVAATEHAAIEGLDPATGILYCGNESSYQKILSDYAKRGADNWKKIMRLYAQEDWPDYATEVHGIKSSMMTIGALSLSEAARRLEAAAKNGDIGYVHANHAAMLDQLIQTIHAIQAHFGMDPSLIEESLAVAQGELQELSEEEWSQLFTEFEDAAYALDGESMRHLILVHDKDTYHGRAIAAVAEQLMRKIERDDLLSAVTLLEEYAQDL